MALGVIDFYSPVAKGFAAGFFRGDFGDKKRHLLFTIDDLLF
jgi:hypothetical protein